MTGDTDIGIQAHHIGNIPGDTDVEIQAHHIGNIPGDANPTDHQIVNAIQGHPPPPKGQGSGLENIF